MQNKEERKIYQTLDLRIILTVSCFTCFYINLYHIDETNLKRLQLPTSRSSEGTTPKSANESVLLVEDAAIIKELGRNILIILYRCPSRRFS